MGALKPARAHTGPPGTVRPSSGTLTAHGELPPGEGELSGAAGRPHRKDSPGGTATGARRGGRGYFTGRWYEMRKRSAGMTTSAVSTGRPPA